MGFKKTLNQFYKDFRGKEVNGKQSLRAYLVRGSTGSLSLKVANIALKFLTGIVLARLLGPTGLGHYSYVLAILTILVIPTQLGLPELLVREISALSALKKWEQLKGILVRSNQFVLLSSFFLALTCLVLLLLNPTFFDPTLRNVIWWALPMLLLMPLASLRAAALRGLKKVILGILPEQVIKPLSLLILLGFLYFLIDESWFTSVNVMALTTGSTLISFLIGAYWLKKEIPNQVILSQVVYRSRVWVKSAVPFMVIGGLAIMNQKIDLVLLGSLGTSEQVGLYDVANRGANFVAISLSAVNQVVGPLFSSLWAKKDLLSVQKVLTKSSIAIFLFSLPIALIFIFAGEEILNLVFGAEYVLAATALAILCGGYLFNATMGSVGVLLNMTGYEKYTAYGVGVSVISNVILNILLIPTYGIEGAAIASLSSFIVWNTFLGYIVYKKLNILPSFLFLIKKNK